MSTFEYKVVPAPSKGTKAKGLKTTGERFAQALMDIMNSQGREGWEYIRADTLPVEERSGLTGKSTTYQNMLVFRRTKDSLSPEKPAQITQIAPPQMPEKTPPLSVDDPSQIADTLTPSPKLDPISEPTEGASPAIGPAKASG